jgi:hypothetical protein
MLVPVPTRKPMAIFVALLQEDEEILFGLSHANSNFKKVKRHLVTVITIYKPEMIFQRRLQLTRANGSDFGPNRIRSSPNPTKRKKSNRPSVSAAVVT